MATANKFNNWVQNLGAKVVDCANDTFTIALCAAANAPVATNAVLADLTQISYTNLSTRDCTGNSWSNASGVSKFNLTDLVLTASGTVATFRYVVLYDNTPTSPADPLCLWWDYGSNVTLNNTDTFTIDFSASNGIFQLS